MVPSKVRVKRGSLVMLKPASATLFKMSKVLDIPMEEFFKGIDI